jgi:hypothetical protein
MSDLYRPMSNMSHIEQCNNHSLVQPLLLQYQSQNQILMSFDKLVVSIAVGIYPNGPGSEYKVLLKSEKMLLFQ